MHELDVETLVCAKTKSSHWFVQPLHGELLVYAISSMPYVGDWFTWRRGRIRERLDRSICSRKWNDLFPLSGFINGDMKKLDHRPILVDSKYYENVQVEVKNLLQEISGSLVI